MTPHPALALAATILLGGCGTTTAQTVTTNPPETNFPFPTIPPTTIRTIAPAVATAVAEPVTVRTTTEPPFDPVTFCNNLTYDWGTMDSPMACFRAAATAEGVSQQGINEAEPWIFDLIVKESGGCPFLIGGDTDFTAGGCTPKIRGHGEDTGFGQATSSYWGKIGLLCREYGICQPWQIVASPYESMRYSVVIPSMRDGRYAWCDYEGAPIYHNCGLVSEDWRLT